MSLTLACKLLRYVDAEDEMRQRKYVLKTCILFHLQRTLGKFLDHVRVKRRINNN